MSFSCGVRGKEGFRAWDGSRWLRMRTDACLQGLPIWKLSSSFIMVQSSPYVTCQGCSVLCLPVGRGEDTILFQSVKPDTRCFALIDRILIAQSPATTAITVWSITNTVVLVILSKHCPVCCSFMCTTSCGQTVGMFDKPGYCRASQNKGLVKWVNS